MIYRFREEENKHKVNEDVDPPHTLDVYIKFVLLMYKHHTRFCRVCLVHLIHLISYIDKSRKLSVSSLINFSALAKLLLPYEVDINPRAYFWNIDFLYPSVS